MDYPSYPIYQEQRFNLPELRGLSQRQIGEHLKLYVGYVNNVNGLLSKINEFSTNQPDHTSVLAELRRRLGFEWNGMRLHEYYFEELGGSGSLVKEGPLGIALSARYGNLDQWKQHLSTLGMMRGIGWVITYYDPKVSSFHTAWVADHEVGHLSSLPIICALDVWEHAYLLDYLPSQRKEYIAAFFDNLNWAILEERFGQLI